MSLIKQLLLLLIINPAISIGQFTDPSLDSAFHRMGVGGYFENGLDYYTIESSQVRPIYFSGLVSNNGTSDLTNCQLWVEVKLGTNVVFSSNSDTVDILASTSDSLFCVDTYLPIGNGNYDIKFWVSSDSVDQDNSNDTITFSFEISEINFGRSNAQVTDFCTIPADSIGSIGYFSVGNIYESGPSGFCLSGLQFFLPDSSVNEGQLMFFPVLQLDTANQTWNYLTGFDDYLTQIGDLNQTVIVPGPWGESGFQIDPNQIFTVLVGAYSNSLLLTECQKVDSNSVLWMMNGNYYYLNSANAVNYELISNCFGSITSNEPTGIKVEPNYPNPFSDITAISFELLRPENLSIIIYGINGKELRRTNYGELLAGSHSIMIERGNLAKGVYIYHLKGETSLYTGKLTVM